MVVDELLPILAGHGVDTASIGLLGWSMGGYGALRLAGLLGPARVSAVVATQPGPVERRRRRVRLRVRRTRRVRRGPVTGHQRDLAGIAVRIDCGTGDPFYRAVQDYVAGFPDGADVTSTFEPGAHEAAYWRRMLPAQLAFLGDHLRPPRSRSGPAPE